MNNNLETRLLIPLFEHLKTDPVIVNYKVFSQSCAEIMFVLTFLVTNMCVIRGCFATLRNTNEFELKFYNGMKRILDHKIDNSDDEDDLNQYDENGNELKTVNLCDETTNVAEERNQELLETDTGLFNAVENL